MANTTNVSVQSLKWSLFCWYEFCLLRKNFQASFKSWCSFLTSPLRQPGNVTELSTLPDYPGDSRFWTKSPDLRITIWNLPINRLRFSFLARIHVHNRKISNNLCFMSYFNIDINKIQTFIFRINLRSGPFLASPICSLMSSLAKIGPDHKVSQEFRTVGQILANQLVIWFAVKTPEVKTPLWLRSALVSLTLIRHL